MAGDVLGPDPVAARRPVGEGCKQRTPLLAVGLHLRRNQVEHVDRLVEKLRSEGTELPASLTDRSVGQPPNRISVLTTGTEKARLPCRFAAYEIFHEDGP
jgi:hypothetical protein